MNHSVDFYCATGSSPPLSPSTDAYRATGTSPPPQPLALSQGIVGGFTVPAGLRMILILRGLIVLSDFSGFSHCNEMLRNVAECNVTKLRKTQAVTITLSLSRKFQKVSGRGAQSCPLHHSTAISLLFPSPAKSHQTGCM